MKGVTMGICDVSNNDKLDENVKYVTIDITSVDSQLLSYLKENGKNCFFTDRIDGKRGFVYVDYDTFFLAQSMIDGIISRAVKDLSKLEMARYLYISLGKILGYDINVSEEKNDYLDFSHISSVNNIWEALVVGKGSNISIAKLYLYLCSLCGIECEMIKTTSECVTNKVSIDGNSFIVNLPKDLCYIQSNFPTVAFGSYNRDSVLDRKVGYIKDDYSDVVIDKIMRKLDYANENILGLILVQTQQVLEVNRMKSFELGLIYAYLFEKYCSSLDVVINNLYVNSKDRQHFILVTLDSVHYSYNYKKNSFMPVDEEQLVSGLIDKKIGLYANETIPMRANSLSM